MSAGLAVGVLAAAALGWAVVGLATGAAAALLAAPLALGLAVLASWLRRDERAAVPRYAAGAAAAGSLLALGLLVAGAGSAAAAGLLLSLAVGFTAGQLSLAGVAAPAGAPRLDPLSPRLNAAVAADELLRLAWTVRGWRRPGPPPPAWAAALRESAERNRALGWTESPERAHPIPPALEKVDRARASVAGMGSAEHLRFASEWEPDDPHVRDDYLALAANRTAHAFAWRHAGAPRPALLCLHGLGMGWPALDARLLDLPFLHRRVGLDVLLVILPLHGPRAAGRSGQGFLDGHPLWAPAALGQAVWDLRRLAGWLLGQGSPAVGVLGRSLGGTAAALFASLERRLACAVPVVPAVSIPDLVLRDLTPRERLAREAQGATRALLEDAWAPASPLRHAPRVAPEGRLVVAGAADRICPADQTLALWEHWDRPALHWFPGSHLVPLGRAALRRRLEAHLRATLVAAADGPALPLTRFR